MTGWFRITKFEFYNLGGLRHSDLCRKANKLGVWIHFMRTGS